MEEEQENRTIKRVVVAVRPMEGGVADALPSERGEESIEDLFNQAKAMARGFPDKEETEEKLTLLVKRYRETSSIAEQERAVDAIYIYTAMFRARENIKANVEWKKEEVIQHYIRPISEIMLGHRERNREAVVQGAIKLIDAIEKA